VLFFWVRYRFTNNLNKFTFVLFFCYISYHILREYEKKEKTIRIDFDFQDRWSDHLFYFLSLKHKDKKRITYSSNTNTIWS